MSAPALTLDLNAGEKVVETSPTVDAWAALAKKSVYFKVSRRIDTSRLNWFQRWGYEIVCRKLPAWLRVPPVVPVDRGGLDHLADALAECETPDDQVRALPWNWTYSGDGSDEDVICRPLDPTDAVRTARMIQLFSGKVACPAVPIEVKILKQMDHKFEQLEGHLGASERKVGRMHQTLNPDT